ncbi:MAG: C1 family peptidase [Aquabacterium sp.]|uniref:hypothetical protein n=1 Tax=Aquabacterium sp. TaxID=1872578 RepID=UPI003BAF0A96
MRADLEALAVQQAAHLGLGQAQEAAAGFFQRVPLREFERTVADGVVVRGDAAFCSWRCRKAGLPTKVASVSPRMLYNFARRYDEYDGEDDDGSSCRGALKGWFNHGVCLEADWPYSDASPTPKYGYAKRAAAHTLGVYFRVDLGFITDLQAAIQEVGAVYVSAFTHDGWSEIPHQAKSPANHAALPVIPFDGRPSETDGHAFALWGFNAQGFAIQNPWGTGWGVGGFAILTYGDWLANAMDAWVVAMGVPGVVVGRVTAQGQSGTRARR